MKQNIKRASVITLLAISLGAATTPSIASAATLNNQQDVTATNQQQFNKELEQKNNNVNIKNYSEVQYDAKNNQTTVTISDIELRQYLIAQGANPNQLGNLGLMRSYGVSKIVWYGRISNGNANLYLSKGGITSSKISRIYRNILLWIIPSICRKLFRSCKKLLKFCKLGN